MAEVTCPACKRSMDHPPGTSIRCVCGHEARWVTEEQANQLFAMLEAEHGPPTLEHVAVGEDGSTTEVERWGDQTTTRRRIPLPPESK